MMILSLSSGDNMIWVYLPTKKMNVSQCFMLMLLNVYRIRKLFSEKYRETNQKSYLKRLYNPSYYRMISIRLEKIHPFLCGSEQILVVSLLSDSTCFITQYTADKGGIFWMDLCG